MAGYLSYMKEAFGEIESRKKKAEAIAEARKTAIYKLFPRLGEIDTQLAETMITVSKAVISGDDVETKMSEIRNDVEKLNNEKKGILSEHGISLDDLKPKYSCPVCGDTGRIDGAYCKCAVDTAKSMLYKQMGKGEVLKSKRFSNFDLELYPEKDKDGNAIRSRMKTVYTDAMDFSEKFDYRNFLFMGRTGLGKTHISLAVANVLLEKGVDVVYTSAPTLFLKMERERFNEGESEKYYDMLDTAISAELLILDDLGSEMVTKFTVSALYQIINERLQNRKPTIISTNFSVKEIDENYGERIASRIFGNYDAYLFVGSDVRRMVKN